LLDASRNGIVDARVLKERQQLAEDGVVTVLAAVSTDGVMVAPPRVNLRGVVTTADARKMSLWTEREIAWVLENRWKQLTRQISGKTQEVDWMGIQREVEVGLGRRMRRELQVEPLILCLVQPAPAGTPAYQGRSDDVPDTRPVSRDKDSVVRAGSSSRSVPAPVRIGKASSATPSSSKEKVATNQSVALKTDSRRKSVEEVPSGRTRRRRSAVA